MHEIERVGPDENILRGRISRGSSSSIRSIRSGGSATQISRLVLAGMMSKEEFVEQTRPAEDELLYLTASEHREGEARLHVELIAVVDEAAQEHPH